MEVELLKPDQLPLALLASTVAALLTPQTSLKGWSAMLISGGAPFAPLNESASEQSYPTLVFNYSELGSKRLGAFNSLDLRLDKKWNFNRWSLDVYLEVANALGSKLPSPPQYGLKRDSNGQPIFPNEIVEIDATDNSSILPTIGIVVDI